jgi:RNA polymerase sigma-70 factor (ECF subfamily)
MSDAADDAFRRHYEAVYRFVRSRAPRHDAEDLTQEVFVAAVVALGDARVESPPPLQWLYTVARRRLLDQARRQRLLPSTPAVDELGDAAQHAYAPQLAAALAQAVSGLTEEQRQVVVLKLFEGCTLAEAAARLSTSEAACKMRLARGLAQLRRRLAEQGLEP